MIGSLKSKLTFLRDVRQPEVDYLEYSAVVSPSFLGKQSLRRQRHYEWRFGNRQNLNWVNGSLQVDVRHSKTPLLNLFIAGEAEDELLIRSASLSQLSNRENDRKKGLSMKRYHYRLLYCFNFLKYTGLFWAEFKKLCQKIFQSFNCLFEANIT